MEIEQSQEFYLTRGKSQVKVKLEFANEDNESVTQDIMNELKEIYLRKQENV